MPDGGELIAQATLSTVGCGELGARGEGVVSSSRAQDISKEKIPLLKWHKGPDPGAPVSLAGPPRLEKDVPCASQLPTGTRTSEL